MIHFLNKIKHHLFSSKKGLLLGVGIVCFLLNGCAEKPHSPLTIETLPAPALETPLLTEAPKKPPLSAVFKVALLLPLTGEKQALGEALLKGAELRFFNQGAPFLELLPTNTQAKESNEKEIGALKALSNLLERNDIDLILGPLMADDVTAITPLAWEKGIPIISFSNMPQVAGDNVFIMGFSPEDQIKKAIEYALSQNITQFLAIVPLGEYGRLVVQSLRQGLYASSSAKLKDVIYYDPNGTDLDEKLKTINLTDIQAIVIPAGGTRLLQIVDFLTQDPLYQTIKPRLIGSGQWDEPSIFQNQLLQGAWFAGTRSPQWDTFSEAYHTAYGSEPPRVSSLGYDALMVAAAVARDPQKAVSQSLMRLQGFEGVEGRFSFTPQGNILREWHVFEIDARVPHFYKQVDQKRI